MKKKMLALLILFITTYCFSSLLPDYIVEAADTTTIPTTTIPTTTIPTATVNQIQITQNPTKTTYAQGESLDTTNMIVTCYYNDGTNNIITDYVVEGYDCNKVGIQTITVNYQNFSASFNITVIPAKVNHISVSSHNTTSLTLTWDTLPDITSYEVYCLDNTTSTYNLVGSTNLNRIIFNYTPGTIQRYKVCAIKDVSGTKYTGELSNPYTAATNPEKVTGLTTVGSTTNSVTLSWNSVSGATGYYIYRSPVTSTSFSYCGKVSTTSYTNKSLTSGTSYKYKVRAYTLNTSYFGGYSSIVKTSTYPDTVKLNLKAGDQKIRITWSKVTGASYYDIYIGDKNNDYSLLATNTGNSNCSYIAEGLTNGESYSFYAIAQRKYNGVVYSSAASSKKAIIPTEPENTSTTAKYFSTKKSFSKSMAYITFDFFQKNVNYSKSIVIPGLITTNVGGFSSTSMCPQGITFAGNYLLLTAYDRASEENSVIYVMDKYSKKLLTTLILPSKAHAGGITYDGQNVWITTGTKVSSILFSDIITAATEGTSYSYINYNAICELGITASFITYYNNKLWVGSYNELESTKLYSYTIENITTTPSLTQTDTINIPTRVQGISFTSNGNLILSRSCQLYKGLRGYIHQLDIYKPAFSEESNGIIPLGDCIKSVDMPSMNEEIAIWGSYLYVNFESAAFDNASYIMDRICAFKLSDILK